MLDDLYFSRKERRGRKDIIPIPIHACAGVVANFVTTRERREFRVCCEKTKTMTMTKLTTDDTDWMGLSQILLYQRIQQMERDFPCS